ncbi:MULTISPECIES: bifunctional diguanylate cyclase/phosphodiesterase [Alteromonas]|jgi:diguanylate cyclase (GGDEF)-like protein|uniref:Diguanylate phosphodiesterase n=2 Tax=Alteromonas stellipolaris TaxID=233316 RepID=A0AAW7Z480_9ALTE|nr:MULTISPECIES: EAL domain-containing protein [Alteromonas]AMJ91952.1 diguanylate phosphodiesterase [Alteromonas sp. Mac2]ALM89181.1 Response regulator/GGDEF/EAL domain protein [Alteromonas stellipolaris LMG 21856]AMJ75665.1 diguanylate phosphodiesterase [Alteromonas stellipolaris]AMJ88089.1 diguanylate phosphodiesterase [Alteromonas sp. Mac1]AMJ95767.1 diguanylate phosphodiesterase [Alteromonas stellipolaris]
MSATDYDNDELIFLDDDGSSDIDTTIYKEWNILIVDDDEEIHTVTRLALSDLIVNDRKLNFLHAYSAKEAKTLLHDYGKSIAIILLDVVMETDDAGFDVVRYIRESMGLTEPRIVLRTGQPGYAPEEEVIKLYDINDYKTKTELTRAKLMTTVISSLRSYQQIMTINQNRIGLEKIITSSANLFEEHSVKGFCEGVVTQISSLIGLDAEGLVCARAGSVLDKDDNGVYILGAAGEYASFINESIDNINNSEISEQVGRCLRLKRHIFESDSSVLYINRSGFEAAVYVNMVSEITNLDKSLLEVFLSSISVGYENVNLFHQLRNAAFRDWLTRLPNRNEFINMLDKPHIFACENCSVALIDVNHFSDINDGLGQEAGNELLRAISDRFQACFDDSVKIGRIGADVFGLIGPSNVVNPDNINSLFQSSFKVSDHTLPVNVTIGLCQLDDKRNIGLEILKRINIALNRAKKNISDNFEYFAKDIEDKTTWRLEMIRRLRSDFMARKLELWFQPQVDLVSEKVVGMEGLLRWPDGNNGYISPAVFVPMAEYSGLIVDIGEWVLEEACRRLKDLKEANFGDLRVAVNISMPQFRDRSFVSKVLGTISASECDPSLLELEITESVVMDEPQIVIDALRTLKEHGVAIAIDDFGTGFSSMSYLQQLPLDRLKVDRSFIRDIEPGKSAVLAETIVTLGNKLGLLTIAEGIETKEQAEYMIELGCNEAQGFFYAKPMPFSELMDYLVSQKDAN